MEVDEPKKSSSRISESKEKSSSRRSASSKKISVQVISEEKVSEKDFEPIEKAEDAEDAKMQVKEAGLTEKDWEANEVIEAIEAAEVKAEVDPEISNSESSEPELIQRRIRRRPVYKKSEISQESSENVKEED